MSKISLAAQLAKQASEAALQEARAGYEDPALDANAPVAPAKPGPWKVPELAQDFRLDDALAAASARVTTHYAKALASEGLLVHKREAGPHTEPDSNPVAATEVREARSGRLLRAYGAPELVTMFAVQRGEMGVVADGIV
jgi:hypothetical protein